MSEKNVRPLKNILKIFLPKNLELPGLGEKGQMAVVKTGELGAKHQVPVGLENYGFYAKFSKQKKDTSLYACAMIPVAS
jgi:hypothetical protein